MAELVNAFYTTWLFKLERLVIRVIAQQASTDDDVARLAEGSTQKFAVWTVEERTPTQLLLCDSHGRTRSWLMVESASNQGHASTRLLFGSAVTPIISDHGKTGLGTGFRLLLPIHRAYSKLLLNACRARLRRAET